ncbi:tetratricopeptide repeat protein [Hymenobacter sp. BT770]|uniref:tetratricopeptide repeat protein n=1 Tax=Hymenobacter sp. BT770 TaxID=2886942 RepID=UPI001D0F9479|nr:tetratricopeptide repeat protein [Hymenobacter sp. BT770]MCC3151744.1 tetratricopeptide repeat protein [Hymenobacter sp. BT770]MDO3413634.1 tetratricopeptide repeat protein [Hymenobacter sp. BT770]
MLDDLFACLRLAKVPAEIEALQNGIWQLWLTTGDAALDKELETGMRALKAGDHTVAIRHFSHLIQLNPDFTEAWNKRATAYYLRGEYRASLDDIAETLRREPRHFGALWGQASILQQLGEYRLALKVLGRLAVICPHLPGLQEQQLSLREQMEEGGLLGQ